MVIRAIRSANRTEVAVLLSISTRSVALLVRGTRGCNRGRLTEGAMLMSIESLSMRVVAIAIRVLAQGTTHPRGRIAAVCHVYLSSR